MNTREQFGNYLLLKKLNEDSLGETFRAGRFGKQGIEQVVLLRVLNGTALDGVQVAQRSANRLTIQSALKNPHLGNGLEFGDLQGVPFLVYDYISGKNLSSLIQKAKKQRMPLPTDHALLIADRMALGLVAGYENRLEGSRILHGFLVPGLVMLSNEGESRLLGFEVAPALRELAPENSALREYERFLSPEALSGQPLNKADDVFSLGVILYEMLTGKEMPVSSSSSREALLSGALLANDQEPIPPSIQQLILRSLLPQDQRIKDCEAWHKALSQLMIEGGYNATTFNLAFFMHSLFREDIERESRELVNEKKIDSPGVPLEAPVKPEAPTESTRAAETVMVSASALQEEVETQEPEEEKSRRGLLTAIAAILALCVLGGGVYWFLQQKNAAETSPPPEPTAAVDPVPEEPAGPTQEELQAELERMRAEMADALTAQNEEMKQSLSDQYEGRIRDLQKQYQDSQTAIEQKRRKEEKQAALASQQAAAEEAARRRAQASAEAEAEAASQAAAKPPAAAKEPETQIPAAATQEESVKVAETAPRQEPPPAEPPPKAPVEPPVRLGQLVQSGPGVVAPRILNRAQARYPPTALRARRSATIMLRVLVDENGKVVQTEQIGKRAGLGLDEAAITAAKQSTFKPATKNGTRVKMWHSLRFDFKP